MNDLARWLFICLCLGILNSRAAPQMVPLTAILNGHEAGEVNSFIDSNRLTGLDLAPIRSQLEQLLPPPDFQKLRTNSAGLVPPETLEKAGVRTRFDMQALAVDLDIPVEKRRMQSLNLVGNSALTAARTLKPSDFSMYVNVRGGADYIEASKIYPDGFAKPQFAIENAFNWKSAVLENEVDINPTPQQSWQKRDTRLTWDQPDKRWRWSIGDLLYPITSFQSFQAMAGITLHSDDTLQPFHITSPLGQSTFFLQSDSKVEVIVNGHAVQTVQMSAGPHQINNFPLTGGANSVTLRITDAFGRIQYVNANLFYDPGLLKAGETEFNYAIGFPSAINLSSPFYEYDIHPEATFFHRWGLTDRFTAGVNAEATESTQTAGTEAILSTIAGTFGFESVFSHDRDIGSGTAQRLQYHYYFPHEGRFSDGNLMLGAQFQSGAYTQPQPFGFIRTNSDLWSVQARYSQALTDSLIAGAGYAREFAAGTTRLETFFLSAGYNWRNVHTDINLEHNRGIGQHDWRVVLSMTINFGHGHSTYSSYDSGSHSARSEWQYVPPTDVDSVASTMGFQTSPSQTDVYGNLHYFGRRAELTVNQDSTIEGEHRTSFRFGTALVYADGQFAVSRPVQDSFLIVDSIGSLAQDGGVGVEPRGKQFTAKEDWLGPAVLAQITPYYPTHVTAASKNPAADFDPQTGDVLLNPTYKSGSHLRLGHAPTINASVTLQWADGSPAALQLCKLSVDGGAPMEFVSNREGVAYLSEVKPGRYQAALASHPESSFTLVVPPTKEREITLGTIKIPVNP